MKKLLKGLKRFATARWAWALRKGQHPRRSTFLTPIYIYFFARTLSNVELTFLSDPKYACFVLAEQSMPVTASFKFDDFEALFTWFIFHFPNAFYDFQIE